MSPELKAWIESLLNSMIVALNNGLTSLQSVPIGGGGTTPPGPTGPTGPTDPGPVDPPPVTGEDYGTHNVAPYYNTLPLDYSGDWFGAKVINVNQPFTLHVLGGEGKSSVILTATVGNEHDHPTKFRAFWKGQEIRDLYMNTPTDPLAIAPGETALLTLIPDSGGSFTVQSRFQ